MKIYLFLLIVIGAVILYLGFVHRSLSAHVLHTFIVRNTRQSQPAASKERRNGAGVPFGRLRGANGWKSNLSMGTEKSFPAISLLNDEFNNKTIAKGRRKEDEGPSSEESDPTHELKIEKDDENESRKIFERKAVSNVSLPLMGNFTAQVFQNTLQKSVDKEQMRRQKRLQDYCWGIKEMSNSRAEKNLIFSDRQKVIYCSVAKAACTSWKRMMPVFDGVIADPMDFKTKPDVHRFRHKWLSRVKEKRERERKKKSYFSFLFVRHPFRRILSAYRNKLQNPYNNAYQKTVGSKILKLFRTNVTKSEIQSGKSVTFNEFVEYILYQYYERKVRYFDNHWEVIHSLCDPCHIRYDFIGKVENLEEEANQVLRRIGVFGKVKFPIAAKDKYKKKIGDIMKEYYSTLSKPSIQKLYKIYEADFVSFGYELPDYL